MAITKLLRLKECSRGNKAQHLKNNIRYIMDPEKTQGGLNIGGNAGTDWEWVYDSMIENKRFWHKEDGSQGFHYVVSFPPELDISMEMAHEVAQAFCDRLLGENYLYVYAIHGDKPHLHIHVTFDSVSRLTGMKYHSPHGDWEKRIQPITDDICEKFGLPPLIYGEERVGAPYETWRENKARENGEKTDPDRISWTDLIRDDIDEAILNSDSYESFLEYLQKQHYQIRDGKYLSLKPPGKPKAVRTRSLGPGYGKEEIRDRISREKQKEVPPVVYGDVASIRIILIGKRDRNKSYHMTPFQRQFYNRWRRTCFIRRPDFKDAWKYKKDVVRLRELSEHLRYVLDHDIGSMDDLAKKRADLEKKRKAAGSAFNNAKRKLYRNRLFKLVRQRKEILLSGREVPEKLEEIEMLITQLMPLKQALEAYDKAQAEYDRCRLHLKELRHELKVVEGIEQAAEVDRKENQEIGSDAEDHRAPEKTKENPDLQIGFG